MAIRYPARAARGSRRVMATIIALGLGGLTLTALLPQVPAQGVDGEERADAAGSGVERGTAASAGSIDARALAAPEVLAADVAEARLADRTAALRERHATWLAEREGMPDAPDVLPDVPAWTGLPPLPDAPDGEITRQRWSQDAEVL